MGIILAAAAIREASTSMSKLEECTKINHKIETPPAKSRRSIESDEKGDSNKKRLDRYRPAILYDDDDENTSNPRLEKLINDDKERIEHERNTQMDKNKAKKDMSCEEKSKQKMEASADKFKVFLQKDIPGESPAEQPEASDAKVLDDNDNDGDDIVEVKAPEKVELPATKVDLSGSPQAPRSTSPDPSTPPAWKAKNKRPSTANDESTSKRRKSVSPEPDTTAEMTDQLLRGVVFVISGIQVNKNFHTFNRVIFISLNYITCLQNPDRADMRTKGLKMGAKYRPDWDDACTHLM